MFVKSPFILTAFIYSFCSSLLQSVLNWNISWEGVLLCTATVSRPFINTFLRKYSLRQRKTSFYHELSWDCNFKGITAWIKRIGLKLVWTARLIPLKKIWGESSKVINFYYFFFFQYPSCSLRGKSTGLWFPWFSPLSMTVWSKVLNVLGAPFQGQVSPVSWYAPLVDLHDCVSSTSENSGIWVFVLK